MIQRREPKRPNGVRELSDVDHAKALHAFLMSDGDMDKTHAALDPKVPKRTLEWYAERYRWDLRYEDQHNALAEKAANEALAKKQLDLQMIRAVKRQLLIQVTGEPARDDQPAREAAGAKSMEDAARVLLEYMRAEADLLGVDQARGELPGGVSFIDFIRDAVKSGGEVAIRGSGDGGKAKQPVHDRDDNALGIHTDPDRGLADVEDRG